VADGQLLLVKSPKQALLSGRSRHAVGYQHPALSRKGTYDHNSDVVYIIYRGLDDVWRSRFVHVEDFRAYAKLECTYREAAINCGIVEAIRPILFG
jgi:hypothetical protein